MPPTAQKQLAPRETRAFFNALYQEASAGRPADAPTLAQLKQAEYGEQSVPLDVPTAVEELAASAVYDLYGSDAEIAAALERIGRRRHGCGGQEGHARLQGGAGHALGEAEAAGGPA